MATLARTAQAAAVERLEVAAYTIPVDGPGGEESDGTLTWASTTIVVVEASAGGETGVGYTYGDVAAAAIVDSLLAEAALGSDALAPGRTWTEMRRRVRNAGRPGVASTAIAAVDIALWDLKARLLGLPLSRLLGAFHGAVPVYASGGFANYPLDRLAEQLEGWVADGIEQVKIKTSRQPDRDPARLDVARRAIGDDTLLFVDANGALSRKEALAWARRFREEWGVVWLEEPLTSDDVEGLAWLRERGPAGLDVAAGEYGFVLRDFLELLRAGAVDCLQADVTRCGGITGLLQVAGLSSAWQIDLSAHTAPAVSAHAFCAVERLRHVEWFHDHVRVENMLFDGVLAPEGGALVPDASRPGLGIELRRVDAEEYRA